MKNMFRMPKGYREMSVDELAAAILKSPKNRRMIEAAFNDNPRGGEKMAQFEGVEKQFAEELKTRKSFKEGRGAKADNLSIVKSFQSSEFMKTRGQRGGENIAGAYQRHYEALWAAERGYSYNPATGRTKDEKGRFVYNRGWKEVVDQTGFNLDTMEYVKETNQYRFKGKGNKSYYLNTSQTAHYKDEGYRISQEVQLGQAKIQGRVIPKNPYQQNPVKLGHIGKSTKK